MIAVPGLYGINPTAAPGIKVFYFGSPVPLTEAAVKAEIDAVIQQLKTSGTVPTAKTPTFVRYNSHTPYQLHVSSEAIAPGFYKNLTALQGQRSTYWTGAAFDKHNSADLWAYTATLLPKIAA